MIFESPATRSGSTDTILLYGHLDKQPEFDGWRADLGPWTPKYENGSCTAAAARTTAMRFYASLAALGALDEQGIELPRCVGLIETCEESGSYDLLPYVDAARPARLGVARRVSIRAPATTTRCGSLRAARGRSGDPQVEVLEEGVHSGVFGGIAPSSFRVMRQLFERLEDAKNGNLLPGVFHCEIPDSRVREVEAAASILGDAVWEGAAGLRRGRQAGAADHDRSARGAAEFDVASVVVGHRRGRLPALADAGNVLRPRTALPASCACRRSSTPRRPCSNRRNCSNSIRRTTRRSRSLDAGAATGWSAPDLARRGSRRRSMPRRAATFGADCAYMAPAARSR